MAEKHLSLRSIVAFIFVLFVVVSIGVSLGLEIIALAALIIFIFSVFLVITEVFIRSASALIGAFLMLSLFYVYGLEHFGFGSLAEFVKESVELEIIFTLFGIIVIALLGLRSGLFYYIGIKIAKMSKGDPIRLYVILAVFTYLLGFVLNVDAGIVVVVSLTLAICDVLRIDPRPYILMEIFIVNVSASTTLISAIPNIIVAETAHLSYSFFILYLAPYTAVFFVISLWFLYTRIPPSRKVDYMRAMAIMELDEWLFVRSKFEFYMAVISIVGLILAFVVLREILLVAILFSAVALVSSSKPEELLHEMDWDMILFFMAFYIVVEGLKETGILELVAYGLLDFAGGNIFLLITVFFFISLLISSFLDNIPYIITIIPVVTILVERYPSYEQIFWIALILACNIGGGLNPYSAPQNLIAISMSKKAGKHISTNLYYKGSLGWTLIGGFSSYLYIAVLMYHEKIIECLTYVGFIVGITLVILTIIAAAIYFTMGFRKFKLSIRDIVAYIRSKIIKKKGRISI